VNGCEPNEVIVSSLAPGACFEMPLSRQTVIRGVVLEHLSGSTLVDTGASRHEHWCSEAPVVPFFNESSSEWLKPKGENEMAKKEKKEKLAKAPKEKGLLVTRYEATAKKHEAFLNEEKKSFAALAYRVIVNDGPITFDEIWSKIYRSVTAGTEGKTPKNTVRAALSVLVKNGFLEYVKTREVEKEKAAAA
jgi:HB1, ASXL, restriction endonuclease HTH domain